MSTTLPDAPEPTKPPRDPRGAPKGSFGNPPFVPTDEQRQQVRTYAKTFPHHANHLIARLMGFSRSTLEKHFADDLELGRAQMLASIGAQVINRAMDASTQTAKGDQKDQHFILSRLGGWTTKVEVGEKAARPFGGSVDLSKLSEEELHAYGRLSAIAEGLDPDEVTGGDADA